MSGRAKVLRQLCDRLGYEFEDLDLLDEALTHKSWVNELPPHKHGSYNERLEFLGDAALDLAVAHWLMQMLPGAAEGELTRLRAALVNQATLAKVARRLRLGEALKIGKGEEGSGGRDKDSLLADAMEAVLGAVYLEAGMERLSGLVKGLLQEELEGLRERLDHLDAKSRLQHMVQKNGGPPPTYRLVEESGPDHRPRFTVEAWWGERFLGRGTGASKKEAERSAASDALARLDEDAGEGESSDGYEGN